MTTPMLLPNWQTWSYPMRTNQIMLMLTIDRMNPCVWKKRRARLTLSKLTWEVEPFWKIKKKLIKSKSDHPCFTWRMISYIKGVFQCHYSCLNEEEVDYVLRELHEGICENHATSTSLALKALRNRYFWPTTKASALDLVRRYDKCQRHAHIPKKLSAEQIPLMVT